MYISLLFEAWKYYLSCFICINLFVIFLLALAGIDKWLGFKLYCIRGETGLFPEAYVEELFEDSGPPPMAPPPLPQVPAQVYNLIN